MNNDWVNHQAKQYYSQRGEEGIIETILNLIEADDKWCVEFGAWDGITGSNSFYFIKEHCFNSVLIEGDHNKFLNLQNNMKPYNSICIGKYISFEGENRLDAILQSTPLPENFSLLSIDIDGNDYHVWESLENYRPKCIVIEFNPSISNEIDFVQEKDMALNQGCSPSSLVKLGKKKGYELVASNLNNLFFVDEQYFERFKIADNQLCNIRKDLSKVTYIFNGYDGHIFIRGNGKLDLYSLFYQENKLQLIPKILQQWNPSSPIIRLLQRIHRSLVKRI